MAGASTLCIAARGLSAWTRSIQRPWHEALGLPAEMPGRAAAAWDGRLLLAGGWTDDGRRSAAVEQEIAALQKKKSILFFIGSKAAFLLSFWKKNKLSSM